jgi:ribosomal-protein-alanine N-acetyltransferase
VTEPTPAREAATVAPAGIAHVHVLAAMHAACFEERWSVDAVTEVMAGPGVFAFIAQADGDGGHEFAIARIVGEDSELLSLGVVPGGRRRGIARQLVTAVLRRASERGARQIFLEVAEDNFAAQHLYRFYGFRLVGRRPDYYRRVGGGAIAALTLRRNLVVE